MERGGYGRVYQTIIRNKNISAAAKGLYAYLASFCGTSNECFPGVDMILQEMGMSRDTFYRHINALVAAGVVEKHQIVGEGGKFGRTVYKIVHEVRIHNFPDTKNEESENEDTDFSTADNKDTNNNNILKNNNIKNNSNKKYTCPELKESPPDQNTDLSGILLPLVDRTDYNVPLSKIQKWKDAYPAVDVEQELKRMISWLDANPQKKKTRRGVDRFITTWLSKEQDKGGRYRNSDWQQSASKARPTGFSNFQQRDYDMDDLERQLLEAQKGE